MSKQYRVVDYIEDIDDVIAHEDVVNIFIDDSKRIDALNVNDTLEIRDVETNELEATITRVQ